MTKRTLREAKSNNARSKDKNKRVSRVLSIGKMENNSSSKNKHQKM